MCLIMLYHKVTAPVFSLSTNLKRVTKTLSFQISRKAEDDAIISSLLKSSLAWEGNTFVFIVAQPICAISIPTN